MFKNKLQEYCQKHSIDFVEYKTEQMPNSLPHLPVWKSTVIFQGEEYTGEIANKKRDAEQSVASLILKDLDLKDNKRPQLEITDNKYYTTVLELFDQFYTAKKYTTICLLDIESIPQTLTLQNIAQDIFTVGIVGHTHDKYSQPFPFNKFVIKSSTKDAVDHALSYLTGYAVSMKTPYRFLIVTRDHYGQVITELLNAEKIEAHHITTLEDLVSKI